MSDDIQKPRRGRPPKGPKVMSDEPKPIEAVTLARAESFTETPEFQAAVAKAAQEAAGKAIGAILAKMPVPVGTPVGDKSMMEQLAIAIGQLTEQGSGARRMVAPEVLAKRQTAREVMGELIMKAREDIAKLEADGASRAQIQAAKPQYRALNKLYLNERMIEPFRRGDNNKMVPTVLFWTGVPNECMYPMNKVAEGIFEAFRESIGSVVDGPARANKPLWMTSAGLVIEGDAPESLKVTGHDDASGELSRRFMDQLDVPIANDPNAKEVAVLGTIAPKAKQNYNGDRAA